MPFLVYRPQRSPLAASPNWAVPCKHGPPWGPLRPAAGNPCPLGDAHILFLLPQLSPAHTMAQGRTPCPPRTYSVAKIYMLISVSHMESVGHYLSRMREGSTAQGSPSPISKVNVIQRAPAEKC